MKDRKINNKIKSLMKLKGKTNDDLATAFNMRYESFTNKINQRKFNDLDLIRIAECTETQLAFIDKNGKPLIIFDESDIQE